MTSGVPTGTQVVESITQLMQGVAKAHPLQLQQWVEYPETAWVLQRVMNAGPAFIAEALTHLPLRVDVGFKAKLLGVEDKLDCVELPPNSTGWHFGHVPLGKYAEALKTLGMTSLLEPERRRRGEYWPNVYLESIARGGRDNKPLFHKPIHIATKRKNVVSETAPPHWGSGVMGLGEMLDMILDISILATLRGQNPRAALMNVLQIKMGNRAMPVRFEVLNFYGHEAIRDMPPRPEAKWHLLLVVNPNNKSYKSGSPVVWLEAISREDFREVRTNLDRIYSYFMCDDVSVNEGKQS